MIFTLISAVSVVTAAATPQPQMRPEDTEVWQPEPTVVTPGPAVAASPPSDAIILFDGTNLAQWVTTEDKSPARWTVADGVVTVRKGTGNIETRRSFRDYQLHVEWRIPRGIAGAGQARGNSGVFLASTGTGDAGYELQILDSYRNKTYVNGQAGSVYKQYPPLSNPERAPGEWQSFDVIWTSPVFSAAGVVICPAYLTALMNGVLVQSHVALAGGTVFLGKPRYAAHGLAPIKLQAHGDASLPISFRNIWVRDLK